jgi:hypothetical protein
MQISHAIRQVACNAGTETVHWNLYYTEGSLCLFLHRPFFFHIQLNLIRFKQHLNGNIKILYFLVFMWLSIIQTEFLNGYDTFLFEK